MSFTVEPGRVTGFLGPNGAGKTTTLRMLLDLVEPTAGTATIGGVRYADLDQPIRRVGAVLEAGAAHKGRTGRDHLRIVCQSAGIPLARADEVLGACRARRGRQPDVPGLLAGHAPAPRRRGGAARGPAGADPRRAGQRAGPGGHPVDARPAQDAGRAGPHGPGVQPPAGGDGTARRRPGHHRRRTAGRPGHGGVRDRLNDIRRAGPWCALRSRKSSRPCSAATRWSRPPATATRTSPGRRGRDRRRRAAGGHRHPPAGHERPDLEAAFLELTAGKAAIR